ESNTMNFMEFISFNKNNNPPSYKKTIYYCNIPSTTISTRKIGTINYSSLLQVREIKFDNEVQVHSLEYQTVSETINTEESELIIELNDKKSIDLCKNNSLVPNYIVENADYEDEDYIFYKKVKYSIDEFLENQQKEIESLTEDTHINDDLSNKNKNIREDILALQNNIENLENWYLRREFGEYY
ncbi:17987_t:CDS:1, partial [Gigaspora margarita]